MPKNYGRMFIEGYNYRKEKREDEKTLEEMKRRLEALKKVEVLKKKDGSEYATNSARNIKEAWIRKDELWNETRYYIEGIRIDDITPAELREKIASEIERMEKGIQEREKKLQEMDKLFETEVEKLVNAMKEIDPRVIDSIYYRTNLENEIFCYAWDAQKTS